MIPSTWLDVRCVRSGNRYLVQAVTPAGRVVHVRIGFGADVGRLAALVACWIRGRACVALRSEG